MYDYVRTQYGPGSPWCLGVEGAPLGQQSCVCSQCCPTVPGREQGRPGGSQGSPSPGHQAPPWGRDGPRLGWDISPRVGLVLWGPQLSITGLWWAGDWPCRSITGAGADGPEGLKWGPGSGSSSGEAWGRQGRDSEGRQCPQRSARWADWEKNLYINFIFFLIFVFMSHENVKVKPALERRK